MSHDFVAAGRLVMVNIRGTELDSEQAEFLRANHIRAVCLFRSNIVSAAQIRRLTRELREVMGAAALIAIDQEGGSVVRATFLPQAPSAMALGAVGDEDLAEAVGNAVARGVASLGFNWNFAPVLDVNCNPANPVIAERSFGQDPGAVARLAGAWMRGASAAGVACCVKHFPGHGDTHVDSHRDLPVVDKSVAQLREIELAPFMALRAAAPAFMTAHIVYPQIDPVYPATLSSVILGDLLRRDMAYEGVVITDSLVMKAIHDRFGHEQAAVLALRAGADMVMALGTVQEQQAALQAIEAAKARGELSAAMLARACQRLDDLAQRYPVRWPQIDAEQTRADDALLRRACARGLTGLGRPVAPGVNAPVRVITQREVPSDGVSEAGLSGAQVQQLFAAFDDVAMTLVDVLDDLDWSRLPGDGRNRILVSNRHERYGPSSGRWRPDLHLILWNPYHALDVAAPAVITWGYADGAIDALRSWLAGNGDLPGTSPVQLNAVPGSN